MKHYNDNYAGEFPIWVAIEVSTFGTISNRDEVFHKR